MKMYHICGLVIVCFSPLIISFIFYIISDLFDHRNFECIEDWKKCTCLKCRIKKFKEKVN